MNPQTAVLTILIGIVVACWPVPVTTLTFEQRWEPVKPLLAKQDREQRPLTFEERWEPVKQLPQMLLQDEKLEPRIVPVRTIPIRAEPAVYVEPAVSSGNSGQSKSSAVNEAPLPPERPRAHTIRKASLDICQQHNMRKVHYGRTWRCRK